jgi:DNA-binding NtrC family response regulator
MEKEPLLLIVTAGRRGRRVVEAVRREACYRIETAGCAEEAISSMEKTLPTMVLWESEGFGHEDFKLLLEVRSRWPWVPFIAVSAIADAVRAARAIGFCAANAASSPPSPATLGPDGRIVGRSKVMAGILRVVAVLGRCQLPVLITGETGTGKQLVAEAIHEGSDRRSRPLVDINCAAIPRELFEGEFFGWTRGSFTGAGTDRAGILEKANGSTLILDEIQAMMWDHQGKLLKVMENGISRRIGGEERKIDVRYIALTNKPPGWLVAQGLFREDLYNRLRGKEIRLPPLRERIEDMPLLVEHFLGPLAKTVAPDALSALEAYHWPGNVRELEQILRSARVNAVAAGRERILREDLDFSDPRSATECVETSADEKGYFVRGATLFEVERQVILKALADGGGKLTLIARTLGIDRTTLWRKLRAHRLRF